MYACRQDLSNTSEAISSAGSGEIEAISSAGSPHFSCARQPRCSVLELLRCTQAWHMQHIYIYIYICIYNHTNICVYIFRYACTYEGILHISRRPSAHWRTSMREALMNCSGEENLAGRLLQKTTFWSMRLLLAWCVFFVSLSLSLSIPLSLYTYIYIYREREREEKIEGERERYRAGGWVCKLMCWGYVMPT